MIAALIFSITLIYLSISVSAVATTFDTKAWYITWDATNSTNYNKTWNNITLPQYIYMSTYNVTDNIVISFKTNQIIPDDSIIVIVLNLQKYNKDTLVFKGVGQATSNAIPTKNTTTNYLNQIKYNQEVIALTEIDMNEGTQMTITYRAKGYTNEYPMISFSGLRQQTTGYSIELVACDLYESIQDAASSGTTPEEMRDILSSWGEEELLPGIQDSVQAGVTSGMEEALENEKQEASSDGADNAEQLQGAIDEALGDIEEVQKPFETLGSALSYNGQSATLTFPAMNVPFLGQISQPVSVNLTQKISEIMPTELLNIIRGVLSLALVVFPPLEVIRLFNKLLNKG